MNRLKPTNQVVIIAVVASIAFAYVSSLFINRYKLTNNGSRRIDTLTGRAWILRYEDRSVPVTPQEWDDALRAIRRKQPELSDVDDDTLKERIIKKYPSTPYKDKRVSYWERIQEQ